MRRTAAITGALLITATMLTACGGSDSSVPELDAVAETWETRGPQFRQDVCLPDEDRAIGATEGSEMLQLATIEMFPDQFLDDDVLSAAQVFLNSDIDKAQDPGEWATSGGNVLYLDRGFYVVPARELRPEWFTEPPVEDITENPQFLGYIDPIPDPCAD